MVRVIGFYLMLLGSIAYPPAFLVTGPLMVLCLIAMYRGVKDALALKRLLADQAADRRRYKSAKTIKGMFPS